MAPSDMKWVELTREAATGFLARTKARRSIGSGTVRAYASDMNAGRWRAEVCPPIVVTPSAELIDGNHRLTAFLASDLAVFPTWFLESADSDAFLVMDTGRPRSLEDQMQLRGHEHARHLQALWNTAYHWKGGDTGRGKMSRSQQVAWLESNPNAAKAAAVASTLDRGSKVIRFPIGVTATLYDIACYAEGGDVVEEFLSGASRGSITFPILSRLQQKMADHSNPRNSFRMSRAQIGFSTARVYLAYLNDETGLEKLYATRRTLADLPGWYDWLKAMWPERLEE